MLITNNRTQRQMKLKSIPESIKIYGAPIKGCKVAESAHMITFFNTLRREYPEYAKCCLHIRNEGKRTRQQIEREKAEGFITGASDIILVGNPSFVCEMKSQSPSAKISQEQIDFFTICTVSWCICLHRPRPQGSNRSFQRLAKNA